MKRILCVCPFGRGGAGFDSRIGPLCDALTHLGIEVDFLFARGESNDHQIPVPPGQGPPARSRTGDVLGRLDARLVTGLSEMGYFGVGLISAPIFRPSDLAFGLGEPATTSTDYAAVICCKPWFRTVAPSLRIASKLGVKVALDIDDYDVTPRAWYLRRFDSVVVATASLSRIYRRLDPILIRNVAQHDLLSTQTVLGAAQSALPSVIWVYPRTGIPEGESVKALSAVIGALGDWHLTVVGFPQRVLLSSRAESDSRVVSIDAVNRHQMRRLLEGHRVAIVLDGYSAYERAKGSIRLMEAMASGLAIVSWDVGEAGERVSDGGAGVVAPFRDYRALRLILSNFLNSPDRVTQCGLASQCVIGRDGTWAESALRLAARLDLA